MYLKDKEYQQKVKNVFNNKLQLKLATIFLI